MEIFFKKISHWMNDRILRRVLRNSTYLLLSNLISFFLTIYITRMLGVYNYGVLGIITSYVTNINKLFSFRMNEMVIRYVTQAYENQELKQAGALIKLAGLIEITTSVFAYFFLWATATIGAKFFLKDTVYVQLILFYGLSILTGAAMETANGILRVINRYRAIAFVSLGQNILIAILIFSAAVNNAGLDAIVRAYFLGKATLGLVPVFLVLLWLPKFIGRNWWKSPIRGIPDIRSILRFTISTNISGTISLFTRDGEILWVGAFLSPLFAGYYKTALTVINMVVMPVNPLIDTTYPEMNRAIAAQNWKRVKRLLSKITVLSGAWTATIFTGLLFFGKQLLFAPIALPFFQFQIFPTDFNPAYNIVLILMIGYGLANTLFWNRTLLLAFGRADFATTVGLVGMFIKILLTVTLVPQMHYTTEAVILSAYLGATVLIYTVHGLRLLQNALRGKVAKNQMTEKT